MKWNTSTHIGMSGIDENTKTQNLSASYDNKVPGVEHNPIIFK